MATRSALPGVHSNSSCRTVLLSSRAHTHTQLTFDCEKFLQRPACVRCRRVSRGPPSLSCASSVFVRRARARVCCRTGAQTKSCSHCVGTKTPKSSFAASIGCSSCCCSKIMRIINKQTTGARAVFTNVAGQSTHSEWQKVLTSYDRYWTLRVVISRTAQRTHARNSSSREVSYERRIIDR